MTDKFMGCTVESCVRRMTGPKSYINYRIEEECRYSQNGTCTYKRHEKIESPRREAANKAWKEAGEQERKQDVRIEPARTEA
jgi:hypothetical protein